MTQTTSNDTVNAPVNTPVNGAPDAALGESTPVEEQSALKPLIYILIVPFALIALLQWTDVPALLVKAVTGH